MTTSTAQEALAVDATTDRAASPAAGDRLLTDRCSFESYAADADGRIDGRRVEKFLADLMTELGGNPFEWISTRSLAPSAPFETFNRIPTDWRQKYRWLEVSVVRGGSEGWAVHETQAESSHTPSPNRPRPTSGSHHLAVLVVFRNFENK